LFVFSTQESLCHYSCNSEPFLPHRDLYALPTRRSSDLGVLIDASASGSTWHGGEARLRVVLDNQIPEDSFAALAVAHEPVLRLRSEEHTSELQSRENLVCRLLLEKKKKNISFMFICFQQ